MSDILEILQGYQRMAQESMPDRPLDDFMVTVSWRKDAVKFFFKVRNVETDKFMQFSQYNPNFKLVAHDPQEAVRLMHLIVADYGKKFDGPPKEKKEVKPKPVKEKHPRAKLPKNRDKKYDFDLLYVILDGDTPGYGDLLASVEDHFDISQRAARVCIKYWLEQGMIVKEGPDRSPLAYYRLGKLPVV